MCFRRNFAPPCAVVAWGAVLAFGSVAVVMARAELAPWMQTVIAGSAIEAALYRVMDLPGVRTLYPRPPVEAREAMVKLVASKPEAAQLYALRAHVDEDALDFEAAEKDWKAFVAHSVEPAARTAAQLQLADYYHRRNAGPEEIAALGAAAASPAAGAEGFLPADQQSAWKAFPRALAVAQNQGLDDEAVVSIYKAWVGRYPTEPAVRANDITALLGMRRYDEAQRAISEYKSAFPQDPVLPVRAAALLALDQGDAAAAARAMEMFDAQYQPLWPDDLVATYFQLLDATHMRRAMLASTRDRLLKNSDDLVAASKVFSYYKQQGRTDAAMQSLAEYGAGKEARHASWTAEELYTFAMLLDRAGQYPEAARYYYALAATPGKLSAASQSPEEVGLAGLVHVLLSAPEQSIDLGSGNLSMYRDIATLDHGPGYFNGILSLWLNSTNPASEFHDEEQKAVPYFHREKASALLAALDRRFPESSARAALHAQLIAAYVGYGQDDAVKSAAQNFLANFPESSQRLEVALEVADVEARTRDTKSEFALYDSLLAELAAKLQGMPLTAAGVKNAPAANTSTPTEDASAPETETEQPSSKSASAMAAGDLLRKSLIPPVQPPASGAIAAEYSQILERYLARLTETKQLPAALAVLRRELDRNPNDPLLYQRLGTFLEQNNLAAQEEEVYQKALAKFGDTTFYNKLARLYLRQKRSAEFSALSRKVVTIFAGSELERYFAQVDRTWPQVYLQLNLYAHERFPHELVFTRNLLNAYVAKGTVDAAAHDRLLREHWQESAELQAQFFDGLAGTRKLDAELSALQALAPSAVEQQANPAASRELAEIHLWQSHFERGAPLLDALAQAYPADVRLGQTAASVFRSLAYFDPAKAATAVAIEKHLSAADPSDLDRLATVGDIYADSTAGSLNLNVAQQLAQAAPFWRRMAVVHPGVADGYLQSATVFWDYFQFDDALAQIDAARRRFHNPALYGYEAGAIYEGKRDEARAVAEYVAAAIDSAQPGAARDESARSRLLTLAGRKASGPLVDEATAKAAGETPSIAALTLRVDVLNAMHQQAGVGPLVEAAAGRAATAEKLAALAQFARERQLSRAYEVALRREIELTGDPVERIELQYELARSLVEQKDVAAAQKIMLQVYAANRKIVGVVRATTDFYWNNKQPQRAVSTLVQASQQANASLARQYTLEAVAKSSESGDFNGARSLLKPLLASDPFNPQYLNLQAESFALAHDDAGVRDLYLSTLAALKSAPMSMTERRDKVALIRQGLIPALTSLKDFSGATDQHIALVSAFPEDAGVLQSAAAYARLHGREAQLMAFLSKAVNDSPRDSRFAIDLARVDVQFEDYAGALAAYSKAIAVRADRPELFIARADLEEHQQAFDAACADYERLYLLTYKDPQWMEKVALARARQGRAELAVKALRTAWIEGRPPVAANAFRVAKQLTEWNMLAQAEGFARQGIQLAGNDLLAVAQNEDGAVDYARLLARERKAPEVLRVYGGLLTAGRPSPSSLSVVVQQVEKQGLASVTDAEWRKQLVARRQQQAQTTYRAAVQAMAMVVGELYTPEEKLAFAAVLDAQRANRPAEEVVNVWIPAAHVAGLFDREATWRRDVLLHGGTLAAPQFAPFDALESQRMDHATRAETLELYVAQLKVKQQPAVLTMAAQAWRDAGNRAREAALLRKLVLLRGQQEQQERLFELYLKGSPAALLALAANKDGVADAAANAVLANGTQAQARAAVTNRAAAHAPVWGKASAALVGLYFGDLSAATGSAFASALADGTIGERLQQKPDAEKQLVGAPWFYYGTRYGYFLTLTPKPVHDAEDYLPAVLESGAVESASFSALARTYLDAHRVDAAVAEYRHALELDPADPAPSVAIAEALWEDGRHDAALVEWTAALDRLRDMVDLRAVPETFWTEFATVANDAAEYRIGSLLKPGMNLVLSAYLKKNAGYRANELLRSALIAEVRENPVEAVSWVLTLIGNTPLDEQGALLSDTAASDAFPEAQREIVFRREIELQSAAVQVDEAKMDGAQYALSTLASKQSEYISWLLKQGRAGDAQRVLDGVRKDQRKNEELQKLTVLLAAKLSRIPALLNSFVSEPGMGPSLELVAGVANTLRLEKDAQGSRLLLEYVFAQKLQQQQAEAADYLALAEARLATGDVPGALDLLNRSAQQGDLYQGLDTASRLLVRTGHPAEALPMLTKLAAGVPWNAAYRLRLGQAQLALKQIPAAMESLRAVAAEPQAEYGVRASAASALAPLPGPKQFGPAELTLLASGSPAVAQVSQPYVVYARIAAAGAAPPAQRVSVLRAALRFAPETMVNWLRLRLFEAAMAQGDDQQASVAIEPVLAANPGLRGNLPARHAEEGDVPDTTAVDDAGSAGEDTTAKPDDAYDVAAVLVTDESKRTLVLLLATMDERLGRDAQAIRDLQAAEALTRDTAQVAALEKRVGTLQMRMDVDRENALRRPMLGKSVEQTVLVRPRVMIAPAKHGAEALP